MKIKEIRRGQMGEDEKWRERRKSMKMREWMRIR